MVCVMAMSLQLVFIIGGITAAVGDRILVVTSPLGRSRAMFMDAAAATLATENHVTILTTKHVTGNAESRGSSNRKNVSYKLVTSEALDEFADKIIMDESTRLWESPAQNTPRHSPRSATQLTLLYCQALFQDASLRDFLVSANFQLAIVDEHLNICALQLLAALPDAAPLALCLSTSMPSAGLAYLLNLPSPPSYVPSASSGFPANMSFMQRVKNTFDWFESLYEMYSLYSPLQSESLKHLASKGSPSLPQLYAGVSFVFVNSDLSVDVARPLMPHFALVGGLQCRPAGKLDKELEEFVSGADAGVIVFGTGTTMASSSIPVAILNMLMSVLAQLQSHRVILHYVGDLPPGVKPAANIKVLKWIPQQDLLGHRKTRLFITHGGLQSAMEAAYHAVPVLGIPVFAHQVDNIQRLVELGTALKIDKLTMSKKKLSAAINTILENESYKESAVRLSLVLQDQLTSPHHRLRYFSTYLSRHAGAPHLRNMAASRLNFAQHFLLDVILFVIASAIFICLVMAVVCRRKRSSHRDGGAGKTKEKKC